MQQELQGAQGGKRVEIFVRKKVLSQAPGRKPGQPQEKLPLLKRPTPKQEIRQEEGQGLQEQAQIKVEISNPFNLPDKALLFYGGCLKEFYSRWCELTSNPESCRRLRA